MNDAVLVAIIAGMFNVTIVILARVMSGREHRETSADVKEIRRMINGKKEDG